MNIKFYKFMLQAILYLHHILIFKTTESDFDCYFNQK